MQPYGIGRLGLALGGAGLMWFVFGSRAGQAAETAWPLTVAERSGYTSTSQSAEVVDYLHMLADRAPHIRCFDIGTTKEGRPLTAVVAAQPPVSDFAISPRDARLRVLLLGNIHSGECDGKEALLMLLRELAAQPDHPWLQQMVLVFVPNYNADANDRMNKDNRPGQVGPVNGMGERANAQGFDLNRDFIKLEALETQALVRVINSWDPHAFFDLHTTNGSRHRYPLTYDVPHHPASPLALRQFLRDTMLPTVTQRLEEQEIGTFYYGNFSRDYTQWETYGDEPRYSIEYMGMRGRLAILVESYAYVSYEERIVASREFVRQCLDFLAPRAAEVHTLLASSGARDDSASASVPAASVPLQTEVKPLAAPVTVRGYRRQQDQDGRWQNTDEPQDYQVAFLTDYQPTLSVSRPYAYVVPANATAILDRLRQHGIQLACLSREVTGDIESLTIESVQRAARAYQGHRATRVTVQPASGQRTVPQGSWVALSDQPLGVLLTYLLEPESADGFVNWDLWEPPLAASTEYPVWRIRAPVALPLAAPPSSPSSS